MSQVVVAHLEEIDEQDDGRCPWRPVRQHLGIETFGVNTWTGSEPGDRIINEHDESESDGQEELYLVLHGRASFELGDEHLDAPVGTFVLVPPGVRRTAFASEAGTTILAIGGVPGQAYEPTGWESWAPLNALYEAGQYEEAADRGRELLKTSPPYTALLYNVACCESLAGRYQDAIEHLGQAIQQSEELGPMAREDSDFEPLRGDPAFEVLVGGAGASPEG